MTDDGEERKQLVTFTGPDQGLREPRAQLNDPLLNCVLRASLNTPHQIAQMPFGIERAEARAKYLRACVPELNLYSSYDPAVLMLEVEALNAYYAALYPRFARVVRRPSDPTSLADQRHRHWPPERRRDDGIDCMATAALDRREPARRKGT